MPFDDLDLEFEDEDEASKKKREAVNVDVDLEFQAPDGARAKALPPKPPQKPPPPGAPQPTTRPQGQPGDVRKIDDARAAALRRPAPPTGASPTSRVAGSSAIKDDLDFDLESNQVVELREQMRKMELEAQVRVSVAEFKTDYLTEMLSDMKLMEHQIGQLLARINAKHPDMRNEVLMIKKILTDFNSKKRK